MILDNTSLVATFLIFCRIGACLSLAPGLAMPRIPMRARLLAAIAVTLALAPALVDRARAAAAPASPAELALIIGGEFLVGATLGLMARYMLAALETFAVAAAMSVGMSSIFVQRIDENDMLPDLSSFVSLAATTLFFVANLHFEILRALFDSYTPYPVGAALDIGQGLDRMTRTLGYAFLVALRLMSPFLLFGLVANIAFGLLNRLVPSIAIYFVSTPFVLLGGLLIAYAAIDTLLPLFMQALAALIARG